jgi:hypothetical protein
VLAENHVMWGSDEISMVTQNHKKSEFGKTTACNYLISKNRRFEIDCGKKILGIYDL